MTEITEKMLENPPKKYRPVPFWSWNEKLDKTETARQIDLMDKAGLGGYFMHARGGLLTEYMGDEWFENVEIGVSEAQKRGMYAWAYDENGWPSGFGGGIVNGLGIKYQQKYLRMEEGEKQTEHTICNRDGYHFYYEINPFYVDTLDKNVVAEFIKRIYQPYYDKFGGRLEGIFTDEPQVSRNGIPWSFVLEDAYFKEYGENLCDRLVHLFKKADGYEDTRKKFWRLIAKLFSESYSKQIFEWCDKHGLKFTGHLVLEDNMRIQINANGAVMPSYEYYHIPAMDWLGRRISSPLPQIQVASAARQTGKKQVLTEVFGLCGHSVSFAELRWIVEWQTVRGVNLLCPHLEGYSLRGIRKRDYPPAMYYQQPWWGDYEMFTSAMSRIGMLLAEGGAEFDTLLIHPQTSAWITFDNGENEGLEYYQDALDKAISVLEQKHILFDLGDEIMMERHARVDGNTFIIGNQRYKTVVLPAHKDFFENTKNLLAQFEKNGGKIVRFEDIENLAENRVCDNAEITYTKREFDGFTMHYFVNSTGKEQKCKFFAGNKKFDIMTGKTEDFCGEYTFAPTDSIVLFDTGEKTEKTEEKPLENLVLNGEWEIKKADENAFVLDFCDLYIDGKSYGRVHINSVQQIACGFKKRVNVKCVFDFVCDAVPDEIFLVCETPEKFKFTVNGAEYKFCDVGNYIDISFRKSDISKHLKTGGNVIETECDFVQRDEIYENLEKSRIFESEKNKLTYDNEIEAMYLAGNFSAKARGGFEKLDKNAVRTKGEIYIDAPQKCVNLQNIEQQGFLFFAGKITLAKKFDAKNTNLKLKYTAHGINVCEVGVNGKSASKIIWHPYEADISPYVKEGANELEITITNNLRNLLGPHHLKAGESHSVGPASFFKTADLWNHFRAPEWDDNYCITETSVEFKK